MRCAPQEHYDYRCVHTYTEVGVSLLSVTSLTPGEGAVRVSTTKGSIGLLALLFWMVLATSVLMVVLASPPAHAAAYTVNTTNDSGAGSLRQAIIDANASTGVADTIGFAPSLAGQTITLDSQLPVVAAGGGALTIDGGSAGITVSGGDRVRVFEVGRGANLTLDKLTVADGLLDTSDNLDGGGGIYNNPNGTLTVSNSTISGNATTSSEFPSFTPHGGGIYNRFDSSLTVINSTISGNEGGDGGGIYNDGTLQVSNSTISGNRAAWGGGIYSDQDGLAKIWNTTIAGNRVASGNDGGGMYNESGALATMWNTLLANNIVDPGQDTRSNCLGDITDGGNNFDSGDSCQFSSQNDSFFNTDPLLGSLADNGGPTETHALLAGSPAINAGNNAFAVDPEGVPLQFDQRGAGFARIVGGTVDIGAFEVQGLGSEPPPTEVPEDKQACKKGGYEEFGFRNQGLCIKAVNLAD